jgi:hypothetical protein
MDLLFMSLFLLFLLLYAFLMFKYMGQLINSLRNVNVENAIVRRILKRLGVINLLLPFLIATSAINMYPSLYNDETNQTHLPPVTTIFALICFVILVIILPYFIRPLIKRGIVHKRGDLFVNPFVNSFYTFIIYFIIFGIVVSLTTMISFIERMIIGI